jgi:hypothetical protein
MFLEIYIKYCKFEEWKFKNYSKKYSKMFMIKKTFLIIFLFASYYYPINARLQTKAKASEIEHDIEKYDEDDAVKTIKISNANLVFCRWEILPMERNCYKIADFT